MPEGRESERDDRVLPETRVAAAVIVAILIPALVVLWGMPGETADLWAWTIKPDMTPIFMGAGYGAGAYFFIRVASGSRWHPASAGVISAAWFAALALVVTLVHWDRFNHGDAPTLAAVAFYGWVGVYIASPVVVAWLWLRNRRTDPRSRATGEPAVPPLARLAARAVGVGAMAAAGLLLFAPDAAADVWPWTLSPLTARVIGCFTAQVAMGALLLSADARWGSWRLLLQTFLVAAALLLVGAARAWSDFDEGNPLTWAFVAGLAGMSAGVLALFARMRAAR